MTHSTPLYTTIDDWIAREAIPCPVDSPIAFHAAVAEIVTALGDSVELLGLMTNVGT